MVVWGSLLIQPGFMRNSGKSLEEFALEVDGWLPLLPVVALSELTGQMLADVVRRKSASAGSLDGWGWRELKVLPVPWLDGFARIPSKVEETGVWQEGLLDAYKAMIPKTDGDAIPGSASSECSSCGVSHLGLCSYGAAGGLVSFLGP